MSETTINNPADPDFEDVVHVNESTPESHADRENMKPTLVAFGALRHVIYGDIGGHYDAFVASLHDYGVNTDEHIIPENTVIVQVGDLVHKGPDSEKILAIVSAFAYKYPEQWIQLAGNHELTYTSKQFKFVPETINKPSRTMLRALKADGLLRASYAFTDSMGRDYLVTHAGLTSNNYENLAYRHQLTNPTAYEMSAVLNATPWDEMLTAGIMMHGHPNQSASVFWAECVSEVYYSWLEPETVASFDQIHGHSSIREWGRGGLFRFVYPVWLTENLVSDFDNMRTVFTLNYPNTNQRLSFYAIDHDLGVKSFVSKVMPLVVE